MQVLVPGEDADRDHPVDPEFGVNEMIRYRCTVREAALQEPRQGGGEASDSTDPEFVDEREAAKFNLDEVLSSAMDSYVMCLSKLGVLKVPVR